jgi:hypothetical protein
VAVDMDVIVDGTVHNLTSPGDVEEHATVTGGGFIAPSALPAIGRIDYSAYDVKVIVRNFQYHYVWVPPGTDIG